MCGGLTARMLQELPPKTARGRLTESPLQSWYVWRASKGGGMQGILRGRWLNRADVTGFTIEDSERATHRVAPTDWYVWRASKGCGMQGILRGRRLNRADVTGFTTEDSERATHRVAPTAWYVWRASKGCGMQGILRGRRLYRAGVYGNCHRGEREGDLIESPLQIGMCGGRAEAAGCKESCVGGGLTARMLQELPPKTAGGRLTESPLQLGMCGGRAKAAGCKVVLRVRRLNRAGVYRIYHRRQREGDSQSRP